jgi:hypothetical protein
MSAGEFDNVAGLGSPSRPFLQLFIQSGERFENGNSQKSGGSIVIDFQVNIIHTGRYV